MTLIKTADNADIPALRIWANQRPIKNPRKSAQSASSAMLFRAAICQIAVQKIRVIRDAIPCCDLPNRGTKNPRHQRCYS
jgi:hypothetical protein